VSVCLSVRTQILGTSCPNFTKFSVHVACGGGSVFLWRRCDMLCTSGFVSNVVTLPPYQPRSSVVYDLSLLLYDISYIVY